MGSAISQKYVVSCRRRMPRKLPAVLLRATDPTEIAPGGLRRNAGGGWAGSTDAQLSTGSLSEAELP
jgi:hypothetical protein